MTGTNNSVPTIDHIALWHWKRKNMPEIQFIRIEKTGTSGESNTLVAPESLIQKPGLSFHAFASFLQSWKMLRCRKSYEMKLNFLKPNYFFLPEPVQSFKQHKSVAFFFWLKKKSRLTASFYPSSPKASHHPPVPCNIHMAGEESGSQEFCFCICPKHLAGGKSHSQGPCAPQLCQDTEPFVLLCPTTSASCCLPGLF